MKRRIRGYNLFELLITITIIGVVATIAWPTLERYQIKISHSDAVAGVMQAANVMEKCGSYVGGVYTGCDGDYPLVSPNGNYNVTIEIGPGESTYTITARRVSTHSKETCGDFTLDNLGRKGMALYDGKTGSVQECWQE